MFPQYNNAGCSEWVQNHAQALTFVTWEGRSVHDLHFFSLTLNYSLSSCVPSMLAESSWKRPGWKSWSVRRMLYWFASTLLPKAHVSNKSPTGKTGFILFWTFARNYITAALSTFAHYTEFVADPKRRWLKSTPVWEVTSKRLRRVNPVSRHSS